MSSRARLIFVVFAAVLVAAPSCAADEFVEDELVFSIVQADQRGIWFAGEKGAAWLRVGPGTRGAFRFTVDRFGVSGGPFDEDSKGIFFEWDPKGERLSAAASGYRCRVRSREGGILVEELPFLDQLVTFRAQRGLRFECVENRWPCGGVAGEADVEVSIRSASGKPLGEVRAWLHSPALVEKCGTESVISVEDGCGTESPWKMRRRTTDERLDFGDLPPGSYELTLLSHGHRSWRTVLVLCPGQTQRVEAELQPGYDCGMSWAAGR